MVRGIGQARGCKAQPGQFKTLARQLKRSVHGGGRRSGTSSAQLTVPKFRPGYRVPVHTATECPPMS